ncbi:MAG: hypothetical protein Ct9H300mP12_07980 [Acidimicrobiales bacterium]|nr:MAG: hypothetical protein Ct9H300mP12_07980 [Acidimicrobiales bacterium]
MILRRPLLAVGADAHDAHDLVVGGVDHDGSSDVARSGFVSDVAAATPILGGCPRTIWGVWPTHCWSNWSPPK